METVSFSFVGMGLKFCRAGRISKPEQIVRRSGWVPWSACSERNVKISAHPFAGEDASENNSNCLAILPRRLH